MLALTKKSEYALVAVCHMARVGQRIVSAREIAEQHQVPLPLLMNVLKKLNHAGYVRSVRGARGGYNLAVAATRLNLASIVAAVEGPVRFVKCVPGPVPARRACRRSGVCAIREPVHKVHDRLMKFLTGVTISDLAFDADYAAVECSGGKAAVQ
jgi:Rrf2 family protein